MKRTFRFYYLKIIRIFTQKNNSPESMARGIGIGVFVGLTPSVGLQLIPSIFLAVLFRGNKILSVLFTYVSNPITTIPMYGLEFYLGRLLLPNLDDASFAKIKDVVLHFSFSKLGMVGLDSIIVLWTGGLLVAVPGGIIAYFVFYRIIIFYRNNKELRWKLKRFNLKPVDSLKVKSSNLDVDPNLEVVTQTDSDYTNAVKFNNPIYSRVNDKSKLRKKFLLIRKKFYNTQKYLKRKKDDKICSRIKEVLHDRIFSSILFYYPHQGEPSLLGLLEKLSSQTILFPRVSAQNEIEPVKGRPEMNFLPGFKGILEPQGDVYQGKVDIVLVPGIVFMVIAGSGDKQGSRKKLARIGYGGGFYDRFLSKSSSSLKIGICYEFQKIQEDYSEPHDINLDMIITEKRIYYEENNI